MMALSVTWAVLTVHFVAKMLFISVPGMRQEITGGGVPIYYLLLIATTGALYGWRADVYELYSFGAGHLYSQTLSLATLFKGYFDRDGVFNAALVYGVVRFLAAVFVVLCAWMACLSWRAEQCIGDVGFATSIWTTVALFSAISFARLIAGKSPGWTALTEIVPLQLLRPAAPSGDSAIPAIHLSDLHITETEQTPLAENAELSIEDRTLAGLKHAIDAMPELPVIISGDTTDTGAAPEWARFDAWSETFKDRIVLAPGNHDLNIVGYGIESLFKVADLPYHQGRINRLRAYLGAAILTMGPRVRTLDPANQGIGRALVGLGHAFNPIKDEPGARQFEVLSGLFPLAVRVPAGDTVMYAIVWNTVRPSSHPTLNSVGRVDPEQFQRMEKIIALLREEAPEAAVIHVVHHKIGMPGGMVYHRGALSDRKHRLQFASMTMQNAVSLVTAIRKAHKDTVIFHGHHHVRFAAHIGDGVKPAIDVVSAPSSTLPCEGHVKGDGAAPECVSTPGFDVVTLGVQAGHARILTAPQWHACGPGAGTLHAAPVRTGALASR